MSASPGARCVVADPGWKFGDSLPGKGRGASKFYRCMTVEEICQFALPPIADDAWLFLWRVGSMLAEALDVCRAWGFGAQKSEIVWVKTAKHTPVGVPALPAMGMGRTVRNAHEIAIVAKRGRPERSSASVPSVIFAPRGAHSEKPDLFYQHVERFCPGPRVDIFARKWRPGWDAIGDELPERRAS